MRSDKKVILFILSILFISCQFNTTTPEKIFKSKNEINLKSFADLLNINYLNINDSIIFHKNVSNISFLGKQSDTLLTKVLDYKFINNKNRDLLWVITITKPIYFDCHPCSPAFGSILLHKNHTKWSVLKLEYFTNSGNFGEPSPYNWYKLDEDTPALLIKKGITNQGFLVENFEIYTILDDSITKILEINNASQENFSGNKEWSYSSSINLEKSKNKFKNLIVRKSGTINDENDSIIKFDSIYKYEFYADNNKYELMRIK